MKTFKLENEPKIKSGFRTPENYFDNLSAKVASRLPDIKPKTISIFSRKKSLVYSVASIIVLVLMIPIYKNYTSNPSEIDALTLENYIRYNSTVSDTDIVLLLDENDIQNMNVDLDLEDTTIENELSSTNTINTY